MATSRGLYLRVGILILAGIALGIGFLLFLTAGRISATSTTFETYLRESVTGLEVGAPVRFRGVQLGRVSEIGLVISEYPPENNGPVESAFQRVFVRFAIDVKKIGANADLQKGVEQGLRVRLASQGITGVAYLELDFTDPSRFPVGPLPWQPRYAVVPSMPSTVAQVQNAAEAILQRIERAPIEGILTDVQGLIADLRAQVKPEGDVAETMREAAATLRTLRETLVAADIPGAVAELRGVAGDARNLVNSREVKTALSNTAAAAEGLRTSMARLPQAIASLEATVRAARNVTTDTNADLTPILRDLRATTSNLRDTTEALRRSPSQAIFGAPPPASR
jgi:ABC-type transporter Mla subunit MlaD